MVYLIKRIIERSLSIPEFFSSTKKSIQNFFPVNFVASKHFEYFFIIAFTVVIC